MLAVDFLPRKAGNQFMMISVVNNGTKEKKYSLTVLLNVESAMSPNKKLIGNMPSIRTATNERTVT